MQVIAPQPRRVHPLQSLFFKCTFVVAICVLMVVSVIEYRNLVSMERKAIEAIAKRAEEVTELLSIQMGGSIKFGNIEAVEAIVEGVLQTSGRDMTGIVVLDADGSLLYQSKSFVDVGLAEKVVDNARESLTSREPFQAPDGMTFAAPTLFGGGDAIVGVVASVWSPEAALASLAANRNETLLIAIGVFAAALFAAGLYLRTRMSQPLVSLGRAMEHVANDDYDIEVPSIGRKDEIGQMAGRLDEFRMSLAAAKKQQAEATLKGAAFEGSSAAMMMVDLSYKVVSANPAAKQLLQSLMPDLSKVWADADPDALVGGDLSKMAIVQEALRGVLDKATADGDTSIHERLTFEIGGQTLRLAISPAADSDGNIFGCVVEWADRTKSQRDAALLLSINEAQASVSFNTSGKVVDANENFLGLIKGEFKDTAECSLTRMFAGNLENDPEGKEFGRQVFDGTLRNGRFKAYSVHADTTYVLEGSFSVIRNVKGDPESVTFLGLDVTDQERQLNEAEAARLKNAEEQDDVVKRLGAALKELANGDLLCDIKDTMPPAYAMLRDDFNATVTSLRDAISKVTHNAASIRSETAEITSAADDLSRRTEKQAATLEETAAALDELTVSVRSAAEGADDASKMSADAQNNAEQGGEVARKAVTAMDGIKNSSQEISKITSVIDDIAFQTNLLALNAGVEAARAGEAGRGFAVVATEVRALAQRSSDAAREINELISSSGEQVQLGVDLVDKTGKALASIVTSVSEISDRVSTIAASSREQSSGLAEINTAVNELDHVTQQNAAMFEETTAASHALTSEADALVDAVARFKTGSEGSVAPSEVVPVAPAAASATPAAAVTRGNTVMQPQEEIVSDGWEEF